MRCHAQRFARDDGLAGRVRLLLLVAAWSIAPLTAAVAQQPPSPVQPGVPAVALVYSKDYSINLGGLERAHPFDIHKYSKIAKQLVADGLLSNPDFHVPDELTREQTLKVHTEAFLDSLKDSKTVARYLEASLVGALPARVIERGMLRAFRHASGGTLLAARLALKYGVAVNLGGGYHHAKPDRGEGFCVYADMPIAIRLLQEEKLVERVLVVDLDVHQGNGTIVCCKDDPTVFTFSMHQGNIYPIPKEEGDRDIELDAGTGDEQYLETLQRALPEVIRQSRPDLVIYQAGCDVLAGDPLASLKMTAEGIARRDAYVIDTCVQRRIPIVMTLGGGYSENAWKVQHASVRRTVEKYGLVRSDQPPAAPKLVKEKLEKFRLWKKR